MGEARMICRDIRLWRREKALGCATSMEVFRSTSRVILKCGSGLVVPCSPAGCPVRPPVYRREKAGSLLVRCKCAP
ncbi:UNVERIFIED_CONTAM: hypothetical protein Slati_2528600 [Sesamum latifolium]|uniref:Uncharacterized protein n=1 Tax=Sesamum latifolium TaxID=2727402 RepID=A0AAW2WKZ0_9LAMI